MKSIFDHIEQIKKKPHHVRKRIAFGAAAAGTTLVALVWFVGALSSNTFALQGTSFPQSIGGEFVVATYNGNENRPAVSGIAGAGAALSDASAPAHIEIIDAPSSTQRTKQAEQTTIPF